MNKVLLINPPFNIARENYDSSISVGLLSIATFLDSQGVEVKIIDGAREKNYIEKIKKIAFDFKYIGFSVMTTQISNAFKICKLIREINPKAKLIWGGSHPTFFVKETIEHPLVDIVSYGEGEITMLEIVKEKFLAEILGIAYKNKDKSIRINQPRPLLDPAKMTLFNWDLVDREILKDLSLIPSLTSRGCPHRCTFCINAILKNRWRSRTIEQVLGDLKKIKSRSEFKNKKLRFWDENFFVDINRAKAIINNMIGQGLIIPWETTIRANYLNKNQINDKFLAKLKQSGCYLLSFGAESGSPRILKKIKKDITPEEIINSAKMCLRHNIIPQYSFMIGLPGETKKDMHLTLKLIDKLIKLDKRVQILGPQAFRPYPGSELYKECVESGWQAPESLEKWAELAANELNFLTVQDFPWVKHKNFVESMEAYVRFGAHSFKSAMGSSVQTKKFIKFIFVLFCKLRWKLKFFIWPVEFKIAKKFIIK